MPKNSIPTSRQYTALDHACMSLQRYLLQFSPPNMTPRTSPAATIIEAALTTPETRDVAGMMRVNHSGEVCAQALYYGQALVARTPEMRAHLIQAAAEEADHLRWCKERLDELGSHTSYLNPAWFSLSVLLGVLAGLKNDAMSLGFIAETETQVEAHLSQHLARLPEHDVKTHTILSQMRLDEQHHKDQALNCGGQELPAWLKRAMRYTAKIMTKAAYYF